MSLDTATVPAAPAASASSAEPNAAVITAITGHHAQLSEQLRQLTEAVLIAAPSGDYETARKQLLTWYTSELMPHALAEERALYSLAKELSGTRLLIHGMLAEHRALEGAIIRISNADAPVAVVAAAAAALAVFTIHLSKENDLLLPALDEAEVDLGAALAGMHEILGHPDAVEPNGHGCGCGSCGCGASADGDGELLTVGGSTAPALSELDVRTLPHAARHEIIFARLDSLAVTESLVILNDHDPKPLKYQTAALWPDCFEWSYLESGPTLWRVAITRVG